MTLRRNLLIFIGYFGSQTGDDNRCIWGVTLSTLKKMVGQEIFKKKEILFYTYVYTFDVLMCRTT